MKITIEPTTQIIQLDGVETRVWEGVTEHGTKCQLFVALVAVSKDETPDAQVEFERALQEKRQPTTVWPLRMVL